MKSLFCLAAIFASWSLLAQKSDRLALRKLLLPCLLALCLFHHPYIRAQSDTARYASIGDTVSCGKFKYAWVKVALRRMDDGWTRDCRPTKDHYLYWRAIYLDVNNKAWLQTERGEKKVEYYSIPFNYYLDRERQADGTYSELQLIDMETFRGFVCHLLTYDAAGNQTSDLDISIKEFNRLAKKRNKARAVLLKGEENGSCVYGNSLNVPIISLRASGK